MEWGIWRNKLDSRELDFVKWHESRSLLIHVSRNFEIFAKGAIFALFSNWQIENHTAQTLDLSQIQGFQFINQTIFLLDVNEESFFFNFNMIIIG